MLRLQSSLTINSKSVENGPWELHRRRAYDRLLNTSHSGVYFKKNQSRWMVTALIHGTEKKKKKKREKKDNPRTCFIPSFLAALLLGQSRHRVLTVYCHTHREDLWARIRFMNLVLVDRFSLFIVFFASCNWNRTLWNRCVPPPPPVSREHFLFR